MLVSVNYGHVSELFKKLQFKVYAMWMDDGASSLVL